MLEAFRNVVVLGIASSFAGISCSAAQGYRQQGDALLMCYNVAAIAYAVRTCEPSGTLVDAVFGRCSEPEQKFRRAVDDYAGTAADHELSRIVLQQILDEAKPKILSAIMDARITAGKACP
jgi:hypothetical protein